MRVRKSRTYTEICVFIGCFLLVFVSIVQIIVFSHKARSPIQSGTVVNRGLSNEDIYTISHKTPARKSHIMPGSSARIRARSKAQAEVRELEKALAKLMRENTMTPDEARAQMQNELYARKVGSIIQLADKTAMSSSVNATGHRHSSATNPNSGGRNQTVPYAAQKYGLPLTFQQTTANGGQEVAGMDIIKKRKSRPLKHFKDFDNSEEYEVRNALADGENYDLNNITTDYEENHEKVKNQFKLGTELYVDEDLLRKHSGSLLDICPKEPDSLVGNTTDVNLNITLDINEIIKNNSDVLPGGEWKPPSCISRHRVAIVIPYRDRWNHLKVLLHYLIPTLKRQQIHFRIFIVEQYGNETFNKGRIMNAAFREALKLFDFQCVTFHDVDLVPEDDRNMYSCTEQPKHMSISIDKFQYTLPYQGLVGGVLMFRAEHFQLVNGYSNMYWGWGAEDDDMTTRILHHGLRIYRPPSNIARYKMVKHHGRKTSEVAVRMKLLRSAARRSKMEGLNNVQYKLLETHIEKLFTHFIVDIGHP